MARDTIRKTFTVAFALCVVCSVLVSAAAVSLRPAQETNKLLDKKKNILTAAGLLGSEGGDIEALFGQVEARMIDIDSGKYLDGDPGQFDLKKASRDPVLSVAVADDRGAGIKRRSRQMPVYLVKKASGKVDKVILPVFGMGLWSTLWGFISLDRDDLNTIRGLVFYEHGETPGLGGEVDNPAWKALWKGKQAFGLDGDVQISVVRGRVDPAAEGSEYQVDGLSGATITSRGVQNMLRYWLSDNAYGAYLNSLRQEGAA
ncbi:MAG: Na(+)-translocating NADH-quinone reductase subunit C [Candidatus Latescibacterota bacterium]|nr:Na(+)-translocating NADH-quinone reductase subunit C [Candidatus Latescibacterota bacterium]